jgi:DNA processing protein
MTHEYDDQDIATVALREYGGVGPRTFQQLMHRFGTPVAVLEADPGEIAELPRMSREKEEKILRSGDHRETIRHRLSEYASRGIGVATVFSDNYPPALKEISDPPPLLYWRGNLGILLGNCVAIVGTHEPTSEAIAEGVRLGENIAATGAVVVSGLARGIDSAAHIGSLKAELGRTVAVVGCGFDEIYPAENATLAESILENGLLLSEYPPESQVNTGRLLARNRIIIGLARSTIVVEVTSGSGGTASAIKETIRQGKALFTCFNPNVGTSLTNSMGAIQLANDDDWKMVIKYMV